MTDKKAMQTAKFISAWKAYKAAEEESDRLDEAYEKNPESAQIEAAFDKAYKREFIALIKAADAFSTLTGIARHGAETQLRRKEEEIDRIAANWKE